MRCACLYQRVPMTTGCVCLLICCRSSVINIVASSRPTRSFLANRRRPACSSAGRRETVRCVFRAGEDTIYHRNEAPRLQRDAIINPLYERGNYSLRALVARCRDKLILYYQARFFGFL